MTGAAPQLYRTVAAAVPHATERRDAANYRKLHFHSPPVPAGYCENLLLNWKTPPLNLTLFMINDFCTPTAMWCMMYINFYTNGPWIAENCSESLLHLCFSVNRTFLMPRDSVARPRRHRPQPHTTRWIIISRVINCNSRRVNILKGMS